MLKMTVEQIEQNNKKKKPKTTRFMSFLNFPRIQVESKVLNLFRGIKFSLHKGGSYSNFPSLSGSVQSER